MKMKAIFTVEFEVEDGANAHAALDQVLGRAETALKESIERSTPGAAGMDVRPNSTSIAVTSNLREVIGFPIWDDSASSSARITGTAQARTGRGGRPGNCLHTPSTKREGYTRRITSPR
jgi:hypothetical protein